MQTKVFAALAEPSRIAITNLLLRRDSATCCELAGAIGKDASTTFRHLELLEGAGLIGVKRVGRRMVCSVKNKPALKKLMGAAKRIR